MRAGLRTLRQCLSERVNDRTYRLHVGIILVGGREASDLERVDVLGLADQNSGALSVDPASEAGVSRAPSQRRLCPCFSKNTFSVALQLYKTMSESARWEGESTHGNGVAFCKLCQVTVTPLQLCERTLITINSYEGLAVKLLEGAGTGAVRTCWEWA